MSKISDQILRAAIARVVVGGVGGLFRHSVIAPFHYIIRIKKWGNHRVRNHRSIMMRRYRYKLYF